MLSTSLALEKIWDRSKIYFELRAVFQFVLKLAIPQSDCNQMKFTIAIFWRRKKKFEAHFWAQNSIRERVLCEMDQHKWVTVGKPTHN